MAKIKQWLQTLWCKLTGGCVYSDLGLLTWYNIKNETYCFKNVCLKCGKVSKWEVPVASLMPPIHRNPFIVHCDGGAEDGK